jgi:hypothetical protein
MTRGRKLFVGGTVLLAGLGSGISLTMLLFQIEMALLNDSLHVAPGYLPFDGLWGLVTIAILAVGLGIGCFIGIALLGFIGTRMKWLTWDEIDEVLQRDNSLRKVNQAEK